jgi:hypothetical protein
MKTVLICATVFLLAVSACATGTSDSGSSSVSGRVHIGPMCAQANLNSDCPDRPWSGGELHFDSPGAPAEHVVKTDSNGEFSIQLRNGTYSIALKGPNPYDAGRFEAITSYEGPQTVVVGSPAASIKLDFRIRTGIL